MSRKTEIRTTWKARASGKLAGWMIRLLGMTLRKEFQGDFARISESERPLIHVLWHNQIAVAPYLWRKVYPKREVVVLTSASKDGAVLASAVSVFKVGSVHGSTSRRGVAALVALKKAAKEGKDLVFTPDGPRGPRYHLQPGVIKIAQTAGVPIVPFRIEYQSARILKTWDRFRLPFPFSKVLVTAGEPISIPRRLDEEAFEEQRRGVEEIMLEGITDQLEPNEKLS